MNAAPPARTRGISPVWILALVFLGAAYRVAVPVFDLPWNTAPLMAIAFGGGLLLGARFWWAPVLALVASDLVLGLLNPGEGVAAYTLMSAAVIAGVASLGALASRRRSLGPVLWCGTLLSGVLFYLVANTFTWAVLPGYAKTVAGWWQSQTTGLPGFPPAWMFLRNSLIADTIWCGLAALIIAFVRRPTALAASPAEQPR